MQLRYLLLLGFLIHGFIAKTQSGTGILDTSSDASIVAWIKDITTAGISLNKDSIYLSDEVQRLMTDSTYRSLIYPKKYTWEPVQLFIKKQDLKPAFWYLINLYLVDKKSKEMAVRAVLVYDLLFKMDIVLPAVFATYSLLDPEIGGMKDGHSEITAPHILEKKLQVVKDMLYYVAKNRSMKKK